MPNVANENALFTRKAIS